MALDEYAVAGLSGEQVVDFAAKVSVWPHQARDLLSAVAPLIAARVRERAAQDILAHADKHAPADGNEAQRTLRRHLGIAARVAAGKPAVREIAAALLDGIARAHRTTPPTDRTEEPS